MRPGRHKRTQWLIACLAALLMIGSGIVYLATRPSEGVQMAMKLAPGWNLANTLDAYGLGKNAGDPSVYERWWGSDPVTREQIAAIAKAGFHTLRIPITWFEHLDGQNRIDPSWIGRVQTVVDWALEEGLYVIVNAHHDAWYTPDPANITAAEATLRDVWGQIAAHFAEYGDHLLFESMNEPRLIGQPEEWTSGTAEARACVNRLNAAFVETIRAAGGKNVVRYLLLPAYGASVQSDALNDMVLPKDRRLMVSAHLYVPYNFALNIQGSADWSRNVDNDTLEIRDAFRALDERFVSKGIPVVLTEFGAVDKQNEAVRADWAAYVTDFARTLRIPCIWWDTSLMEKATFAWRYPQLLTALIALRP